MNNAGWWFFRRLSGNVQPGAFTVEQYEQDKRALLELKSSATEAPSISTHSQELMLQYPGLLIGSGIAWGRDLFQGEKELEGSRLQLGYQFDYALGMPVIPGSSFKGATRSYFPGQYEGRHEASRLTYIVRLLRAQGLDVPEDQKQAFVAALEGNIFEGKDAHGEPMPMPKRDVVFDALPSKTGEQLFAYDYITPHLNRENPEMSIFAEPIPIEFLKVRGGVHFRFAAKLSDFTWNGITITAAMKWNLLLNIVQDWGIGAKTRVGYGTFVDPDILEKEKQEREAALKPVVPTEPVNFTGNLSVGAKLIVKVIGPNLVQCVINGIPQQLPCPGLKRGMMTLAPIGRVIEVEIKQINKGRITSIVMTKSQLD